MNLGWTQLKTGAVGPTTTANSTSACLKEDSGTSTIGRTRYLIADAIGGWFYFCFFFFLLFQISKGCVCWVCVFEFRFGFGFFVN